MELSQSKPICPIDEDCIRVGNIHTRLDDSGGDEEGRFSIHEVEDHLFQFPFWHLAVGDAEGDVGQKVLEGSSNTIQGLDTIVDEEDLTPSLHLSLNGLDNPIRVPRRDFGLNGEAPLGSG